MSPELEKFPRNVLVCEKSNFLNEKSRHDIHVSKHSFNYKVSLIIKNLLNIIFFTTLLRLSLRRDSFRRKCAAICDSPQISVLIPECGILPANISSVINSFSPYYLVRNLPVYELLEETFLESMVKKGRRENIQMSISSILLFWY